MQEQAPGYKPTKRATGMKKGKQIRSTKNRKNQVRKTSPYSKNRAGVKTTNVAQGYKGMMLNQPLGRQPVQSNNMPGFNFPGAAPML